MLVSAISRPFSKIGETMIRSEHAVGNLQSTWEFSGSENCRNILADGVVKDVAGFGLTFARILGKIMWKLAQIRTPGGF